jgi:hypothetical protein
MATFDMAQELAKSRETLSKLERFLAEGDQKLRQTDDFAARCQELTEKLRRMGEVIPLIEPEPEPVPEPPPRPMRVTVSVPSQALRRATLWERIFHRKRVDDQRSVLVTGTRRVSIEAMVPPWSGGQAPPPVPVTVETVVYEKETGPGIRRFRYRQTTVARQFTFTAADFPPDEAYLGRLQEAYQKRKAQLERQVTDIKDFIRQQSEAVAQQEAQTRRLVEETAVLKKRVEDLPEPPDAAGEIGKIEKHVGEVEQKVKELRGEVQKDERELARLRKTALELCPELKL